MIEREQLPTVPPIVVHPTMPEEAILILEKHFMCPALRAAHLPVTERMTEG